MSSKQRFAAFVIFVVIAVLFVLQQREIKRLAAQNADLRVQLSQMASLKDGDGRLSEKLKAAEEASQANRNELTRLRGQASRLRQVEQENMQLKAQHQQLEQQMREARIAGSSPQRLQATPTTITPDRDTIDLGALELSEGVAARFDLGQGTNCIVTPTALSDGNIAMQIRAEVTNADGTASELATSRLTARPGQQCSISAGDRMIALAVKLK